MKRSIILLLYILFFGWLTTSFAQGLGVTSVTPQDGSTGVNTKVTISVVFNKQLMRLATIGTSTDEILMILPKPVKTTDLEISGNTISLTAHLAANQSYQLVLSGKIVKGMDKSDLGKAITILGTFTTGTSLPTGSISGKLTPLFPIATYQTAVGISTPEHGFEPADRMVIVNPDSSFTIPRVEPGTYNLLGVQVKGLDLDKVLMAFYADSIIVSSGSAITNINFAFTRFQVVSSIPANMAVNLDTNTTLSITFNEPLATRGEDINIEAQLFPKPLSQGKPTLSQDKKTVSLPVVLFRNKVYKVTIFYAQSERENYLLEPVVFTFSTGASLPTGSISGIITNASTAKEGTIYVGLLNESGDLLNPTKVNKDGTYQIANLENGSYYVLCTTIDIGENANSMENYGKIGKPQSSNPDITVPVSAKQTFVAYYGWNGSGDDTPDLVTVSNGGAVTGITMAPGTTTTMKLLSTSPQNGNTNVPWENVSLSFTFNLPLAVPENENDVKNFFSGALQMDIAPSPDSEPTLAFTNYGRTVTIKGRLAANTYYTVLLLQAKDNLGTDLPGDNFTFVNPTTFGFSTGNTLPTTSISGTITLPNKDLNYVVVGMLLNNPYAMSGTGGDNKNINQNSGGKMMKSGFSSIFNNDVPGKGMEDSTTMGGGNQQSNPKFQALGLVNLKTGAYSILIPNGTYWPAASTSILAGMSMMNKSGFYDPDNNGRPDSVMVKDQNLTGINITFQVPRTTNLTGIIRDARQMPVRNASIIIHTESWGDLTTSNEGGVYQFRSIPAGDYTIEIYPPGGTNLQYKKMKLEIGERPIVLNITLGTTERHYKVDSTAAKSYPIIINAINFEGKKLERGDEIAVKINGEKVVGFVTMADSLPVVLRAGADDPATTDKKEGFSVGDTIFFEVYSTMLDREIPAFATYTEGNGKFGTGTQSQVSLNIRRSKQGEKIEELAEHLNVPVRAVFENNSTVEVEFESGKLTGGVKVEMKSLGMALSETVKVAEKIQRAAAFFQVESAMKDTFTAKISFGFSESMLTAAGINESDLIIAFYDSVKKKWKALPTEVDVVKKIASASTKHFSLWSLADKNDNVISGVEETPAVTVVPNEYLLEQNYPNPFNPTTTIRYQLKKGSHTVLTIYNLLGQKVRTLLSKEMPAGSYEIIWDSKTDAGIPVSSGIYFYRLETGSFVQTRKMVLIR